MLICSLAYLNGQAAVDPATVQSAISVLTAKDNGNKAGIEKGVNQVARLWQETDGDEKAFRSFCEENYIADPDEKYQVFSKSATISRVSAVISMRCRYAYRKIYIWITVRCSPSMRSSVHIVLPAI